MGSGAHRMNEYKVEISGFDASRKFFVERTTLRWSEGETNCLRLRYDVRQGSVVFLRLLQAFGDGMSLPIACRAVNVAPRGADGRVMVRLLRLNPRASAAGPAHATEAVAFRAV